MRRSARIQAQQEKKPEQDRSEVNRQKRKRLKKEGVARKQVLKHTLKSKGRGKSNIISNEKVKSKPKAPKAAGTKSQSAIRPSPRVSVPKHKETKKKHREQQEAQAQRQSPPSNIATVTHWLRERMPRKNPKLAKEPPIQKQVQRARNLEPSMQPDTSDGDLQSTNTNRTDGKMLDYYLMERNAGMENKSHDWWTSILKEKIKAHCRRQYTPTTVGSLIALAQSFIDNLSDTTAPEAVYEMVENYHRNLCEKLWESGSYSINDSDFGADLAETRDEDLQRNELFFQHTVMMLSTDHWRFNKTFACSFNQGWHKDTPGLPLAKSNEDGINEVLCFQPDLAIGFRTAAVREGTLPMPIFSDGLMSHFAVTPEAITAQCFPFLIIEAKKANGNMLKARKTSLYVATRALYNISLCMRRTKRTEKFFKYARTFSINISPERYQARIHRATWNEGTNEMVFVYDTLDDKSNYTRNDIAAVIRVIVVNFAEKFMLPLLQEIYKALTQSRGTPTEAADELLQVWQAFAPTIRDWTESELVDNLKKRKAEDDLGPSAKRSNAGSTAGRPSDEIPSGLAHDLPGQVERSVAGASEPMSLNASQHSRPSQDAMVH